MSSRSRKLMFAAVVSGVGVGLSYYFSMADGGLHGDEGNPIAVLDDSRNEVQRKPARRIIWQRIGEQEKLYPGESIRTGSDSEAKIKFTNGTVIELDPDSVVVLNSDGKFGLDFLKGNLYVRSSGQGNVEVRSGGSKIDVNDADLALGASGCGAEVDVARGAENVKVQNAGAKMDCVHLNQALLKTKSPGPNDRRFSRVERVEPFEFEWQPTDPEYNVRLELGARRDALMTVSDVGLIPGEKGVLKAVVKPGIVYWRLVATSKKDPKKILTSSINKLAVIPEMGAKPLEPMDKSTVVLTTEKPQVEFRWANPSKLEKQVIEIAKDFQFKQSFQVLEVDDKIAYFADIKQDGDYYWRVTGFRQGNSRVQVTGPLAMFNLKTRFELLPPVLRNPLAEAQISFETSNTAGFFLGWDQVPGITRYQIVVQPVLEKGMGKSVVDKVVEGQNQFRVNGLLPGTYAWTAFSLDSENKRSGPAPVRKFTIQEVPKLFFTDGRDSETYQYVTSNPSMKAAWQRVAQAAKYKVTARSTETDATIQFDAGENQTTHELPADGVYKVVVEAVDAKDRVVAKSPTRLIKVEALPLLPPPQFSENLPAKLQANRRGTTSLQWRPVEKARAYLVQLKTASGAVAREEKVKGSSAVLKNLMPGEYSLNISSVDEFGRSGPMGESKPLAVPDLSDVRAPKFKGIKVQ